MIRFASRPFLSVTVAAIVSLLAGCAAQTAYRDGQNLVSEGHTTEGLAKLEEANRLEPGSARYRMAVLRTRERYIAEQISNAEVLRNNGKLNEAEQVFRQILVMYGSNDRALAGLRSIEQQRRHSIWLKDAEAAISKKDIDGARAKLRAILLENPRHEGARALLQTLDSTNAQAPEVALAAVYRKPITIEFRDAALRSVFEVISRSSGVNFLFDKDVRTDQRTSIFLKNSTIENAIALTLLTNQLEQRVLDANTVLIYPSTQAKQKDYQRLVVKSFYLTNVEAKTVASTLKTLLKARDVVVDEKLNLLIMRDTPETIKQAEKLVALHDLPEPEVMLEVEVLEVKRTSLLDLGVRWPGQVGLTPLGTGSGNPLTLSDLRHLTTATTGVTVGATNIFAQKTDSDANLLANPRIRTRNHEKAKILIGERVPNITSTSTSTGFVAESVNYVDVGLKLEVEPTIYLDGDVAIKIALEVSSIVSQIETKAGSIAYRIGTRNAQTVLRLKDGENQVLAGLIDDEDRKSSNKVPGLGEIPVVGRLFGDQADDASKTEIVLSITPRIVRNLQRPERSMVEFESGTESSLGAASIANMSGAAKDDAPLGVSPSNNGQFSSTGAPPVGATPAGGAGTPAAPISAPTIQNQVAPLQSTGKVLLERPVTPQNAATSDAASAGTKAIGSGQALVASNSLSTWPPGQTSSLQWQGPTEVKTGDTFALRLLMQSSEPVTSLPVAVGFDPRALQVVSVQEGDFLRQGNVQASFASRVEPTGRILMTGTRSGNTGATQAGAIATINFRAIGPAAAETQIQLLTAAPVGLASSSVASAQPSPHPLRITK